ncbi:MAG: GxxExxY protein [Desulfuromonas sp.]|nr:MAG: GxxExxY protein [Desulfuromonas sp.]
MKEDVLSNKVIGAAIEVHKTLGPGLLESAYEKCLCREFDLIGLPYETQKQLPLSYKNESLDCGYKLDLIVDDSVILELKSVNKLEPIHDAQLLTYLKLTQCRLGMLLNFNVPLMRDGIKRIVNNLV